MKHAHPIKYDQAIILALQNRAVALTFEQGHMLGIWQPAKKKHGIGAMKCPCVICGDVVIITPMMQKVTTFSGGGVPGIKGEILFTTCVVDTNAGQ